MIILYLYTNLLFQIISIYKNQRFIQQKKHIFHENQYFINNLFQMKIF
jgi:hypothetical protein